MHDFLSKNHLVAGLYPVADAFSGGVATDVIAMRDYNKLTFLVMTGAIEDAGISNLLTVTVGTTVSTATTACNFRYRICESSTTVDTWSALSASVASYNAAAAYPAANTMWVVEVTADEVGAALAGASFVRLNIAETANKTVTAACVAILSEPRYPGAVPQTAIA